MSIHPSLKLSGKDKKQRPVLKRTERLRTMMEKEQWKPGDKVCGLPKIKTLRIKIKKEKVAEKAGAAATEGALPDQPLETKALPLKGIGRPTLLGKEQVPAKEPAPRSQDKK